MRNLKVRLKITLGFGLLMVVTLLLAIVGIIGINQISKTSEHQVFVDESNASAITVGAKHYEWLLNLSNSVFLGTEFTGSLDPTSCALGKWKDGDYYKKTTDKTILSKISALDEPHDAIHNRAKDVIEALKNNDKDTAIKIYNDEIVPNVTKTVSLLNEIASLYNAQSSTSAKLMKSTENLVIIIFISATLLSIIISSILAFIISNGISKPLVRITSAISQVSKEGNFDFDKDLLNAIKKDSQSTDEIGFCADSIMKLIERIHIINDDLMLVADCDLSLDVNLLSNKDSMGIALKTMLSNLNSTMGEIIQTSKKIEGSSTDVSSNSMQLAQAATEQTSAVSALTASIGDVSSKTSENTAMAINAAKLGETIKHNAERGTVQMNQMMDAVKQINDASTSIGKVIKVIDDIAFQTNILALNAAVEAARAGEHGKGFAVVAEEVRSLAAKSAEAAKDTSSLIENSMEKAELGARIANETSESLNEIVEGIIESSKIVNIIAVSSENQTKAINEINVGVSQVGEVVRLISKGAEVAASASTVMSEESEALTRYISRYHLKK